MPVASDAGAAMLGHDRFAVEPGRWGSGRIHHNATNTPEPRWSPDPAHAQAWPLPRPQPDPQFVDCLRRQLLAVAMGQSLRKTPGRFTWLGRRGGESPGSGADNRCRDRHGCD
jgi:hypothetical protein